MKTTRQKRAAPFYAAAAVWLAYALVLPLYEPLHYALAAGASLLAFAAAAVLCRGGPVGAVSYTHLTLPTKRLV